MNSITEIFDLGNNIIPVREFVDYYISNREKDERDPGFHVSSIVNTCPRYECIYYVLNGKFPVKEFDLNTIKTFDLGKWLHIGWQNEYLKDIIWGKWECSVCGKTEIGFFPKKCTYHEWCIERGYWKYKEIKIKIPGPPIVGAIDAILFDGNTWRIADLKSWRGYLAKKMISAKESHIDQALLYTHALLNHKELAEEINGCKFPFDKIKDFSIIYIGKEDNIEYEHFYEYDKDRAMELITYPEIIERSVIKIDGEYKNKIPNRLCNSKQCDRATKCDVRNICFEVSSQKDIK